MNRVAERRYINIALLLVIGAVAFVVVRLLAGNYQSHVIVPVVGLRIQATAPAASCEQFGATTSGTPIWVGACVAAAVVDSDTETPVPATDTPSPTVTVVSPTVADTDTPTVVPGTSTGTPTPTFTDVPASDTPAPSDTPTATVGPSVTPLPFPSATPGAPIAPFQSALLCPDWGDLHDTSRFHTLWDSVRGCHYDLEHGQDPFVPGVAAIFPGFDLQELLGGVQVGSTNPSSPVENAWNGKHGGIKWNVNLAHYPGCAGFEGAPVGVDASVIQYHAFGNYAIEFEGRIHSSVALLRQCKAANPSDKGYVFVVQHQDYGQRTVPYQGIVLPYPDTPNPAYDSPRGPYNTIDCDHPTDIRCASTSAQSIWTSKPTGPNANNPFGSKVFNLLFRVRDNYQVLLLADLTYPFSFKWNCSSDGGATYAALPGCRFNNSAGAVHEIAGTIPAAWDNVIGLDTDMRVGRITADILVSRFGDLMPAGVCLQPGAQCFPLKVVSAFVGKYGSQLIDNKINQFSPAAQPERAVCFTAVGVNVPCDTPGAIEAPWIGPHN